jgi:hypothetical protein
MKKQKERGLYIVPSSVNLSRYDFDSCDIVDEITKRVDASGISRDLITIEITESVLGSNFDFMKEQINRFRSLGFQVWMDDFGSGYSSLDVLQSVRFDLVKLDMRFMKQFDNGYKSRVIVTELIKLAISLGIETVAEGVETREQVDFLKTVGCTKLQNVNVPYGVTRIGDRAFSWCQSLISIELPDSIRRIGDCAFNTCSKLKEIQLSCRIEQHDFDTRVNQAKKFLREGNKVKAVIRFKGREMAHTDLGRDVILKFIEALAGFGTTEKKPQLDGRYMSIVINPVKQDKK